MVDLDRFVIPRIKSVWHNVAICLHFTAEDCDSIDKKYSRDIKKCCQELFKLWLTADKGVKPITWQKLLEVLEQLDMMAVAERIKAELNLVSKATIMYMYYFYC